MLGLADAAALPVNAHERHDTVGKDALQVNGIDAVQEIHPRLGCLCHLLDHRPQIPADEFKEGVQCSGAGALFIHVQQHVIGLL